MVPPGRVRLPALLLTVVLLGVGAGGCGGGDADVPDTSWRGQPAVVDGLRIPARATPTAVQLATPDGFADRFWAGVNLGSTTPGHFPGEVSARAPDYRRWFAGMRELGVRVVRIYTLLDPSFYTELRRHNLVHPDGAIYVIHGVWIPEERFLETQDLWDAKVLREQRELVEEVHAAVFGRLTRPPRRGHASGRWTADISRWVVAWSPGVEWDPVATHASERRNPPRRHRGRYVESTGGSTSTEAYIARMMDHLATLDANAGWSRAMTFTNWLTTDPLEHPYEALGREDLVSVDATHVRATARWPGGTFASYHAYPYYPDFLRLEPRYRDAPDSYAAYLGDIADHHRGQALMVTEFGVPSALGSAHLGPQGRDQGAHDERTAARIDADMLGIIRAEGLAGGVLFAWVDEWFKFTWNTLDTEVPGDRRQLWRNALTNEEHFGVVAVEPGLRAKVVVDGDGAEWDAPGHSPALWEAREGITQVRATHDEEALSLLVRGDEDTMRDGLTIGLDVRPGSNGGLPGARGVAVGADVAVSWDGTRLRLRHAAWTDALAAQYGIARDYLDVDPATMRHGSGAWRTPQMILNRPYVVPVTGERRPVELLTLDPLPSGPEAEDARTTGAGGDGVLELRLPWALLGFSDPSSRKLIRPRPDGSLGTETLAPDRPISLTVAGPGGRILARPRGYGFEPWNRVEWHERRKQGWATLADAFARSTASG